MSVNNNYSIHHRPSFKKFPKKYTFKQKTIYLQKIPNYLSIFTKSSENIKRIITKKTLNL